MSVILVTQARIGSSRLPGKVLKKIGNKTLLDIHLERIKKSKLVDEIIVATTTEEGSQKIVDIADNQDVGYYKGSIDNVLDRFYKSVAAKAPDWIVRVTSDCPLLDPDVIDLVISTALKNDVDYCSNTLFEDFPDGQDVEVFKFSALKKAWEEATSIVDKEHVTPYIHRNSSVKGGNLFTSLDVPCFKNYNQIRMTVDEPEDFEVITWIINQVGAGKTWIEYVEFMEENKEKLINSSIIRNEGYLKSIKKEKNG